MRRIIKSAEHRQTGVSSYERDTLEARAPIEEEAPPDPAAILEAARAEAERKVQEAYAEGLRRGEQAGQESFDESVGECIEMLRSAAQSLQDARARFLESLEPQVVQLAMSAASRILKREAQIDPEVVKASVRSALEKLVDQERVTLRVNPSDMEAARNHRVTALEEFDGIQRIDIVGDEEVPAGGCIAETQQLYADTRLDQQIESILDQLLDA